MATNPFDKFDDAGSSANPFDQFDEKPKTKGTGVIRKAGDLAAGFVSGALGATKALTDAAGAGNSASNFLDSATKDVDNLLSPQAQADKQEQSAILQGAEGKGAYDGIKAGFKAFGVAPVQTAVSGFGSVAPIALATMAAGGGAVPALVAGAATGVAMGAGTAKGAIFDEIKDRGLKSGMTEAQATEEATRAQEYGGQNTDQIALGGALGAADALTGVTPVVGKMLRNAVGRPVVEQIAKASGHGILRRAGMGALEEMPLEGLQGGQEQVAANLAAQRAGYQAGTWDNVVSNATLEALASAGPGAAFGAMNREGPAPVVPPMAPPAVPPAPQALGFNPMAGTHTVFPDGSVILNSDASNGAAIVRARKEAERQANINNPLFDPGLPVETPGQVAAVAPSQAMGLDAAAGPMSAAAALAVDSGAHQAPMGESLTGTDGATMLQRAAAGNNPLRDAMAASQAEAEAAIPLDSASDADRRTYEEAFNRPAPPEYMSLPSDARKTILYGNKEVSDGGQQFSGTKDGDILNGMGTPFKTRFAAARRAHMMGKEWGIEPVADGFVARWKGPSNADAIAPAAEQKANGNAQTTTSASAAPAAVPPAAGTPAAQAAGVDKNGFVQGQGGTRVKVESHTKGSNALDPSADIGALTYTIRGGAPLDMVLSKEGKLIVKGEAMNEDGTSNGRAWVPPDQNTSNAVKSLLEKRAATAIGSTERKAIDAEISSAVKSPGVDQARKNNTFTGQAVGAGRLVGMTQPKGTPVEKLFANFADQKNTAEGNSKFRSEMLKRANVDPKQFTNDPVSSSEDKLPSGLTVKIDAAKSGNTRVQVMDGETLVGAAQVRKGMIDSIATSESEKGRGIGAELLSFMDKAGIANIDEVPDRSPGFVRIQKQAIQARSAANPQGTPTDAASIENPGTQTSPAPSAQGTPKTGAATVDDAAHQAATSKTNDLAQPTDGQKKAGNYAKGHVNLNGLDLAIENPAGSVRSGKDKSGKAWSNTLQHHYGYIKGTVGNDKDHVDLFVKPETPLDYSGEVYVIDQVHPETGRFDEHKVMVGFANQDEAEKAYRSNYAKGWKGMKAVTPMAFDGFKAWVKDGPKNTPLAKDQAAAPTDIKAITAKKIPDMTDAELAAALDHYGPEHARTAKIAKEINRRALAAKLKSKPATQGDATNGTQAPETKQAETQGQQPPAAEPVVSDAELEREHQAAKAAWDSAHTDSNGARLRAASDALFAKWWEGMDASQQEKAFQAVGAIGTGKVATKASELPNNNITSKLKSLRGDGWSPASQQAASPETLPNATAPEHVTTGVDDRELGQILIPAGGPSAGKPPKTSVPEKAKAKAKAKADAESAEARRKAAEAESRKAYREVERSLFAELTAMPDMAGKSVEEIESAIKDRLTARDASTALNPIQQSRLARAIHKTLKANAAKLEKQKHQDPQVKADAVATAVGAAYGEDGAAPAQHASFAAGFDHAMAGKTKSTLSGEHLADMVKGYEAAMEWRKTDEGSAWFEGKPSSKLKNTGVDLRRHWDEMRALMKAGETDTQKAWAQIERSTARADLFSPLLPNGASPGFTKYATDFRAQLMPFKKWLESRAANWYGNQEWRRRGRSSDKSNIEFMLEGSRYPSDLSDGDREKFRSDSEYRIKYLQDKAQEYATKFREVTSFLEGTSSVTEAATKFEELYIDAEKVASNAGKSYWAHVLNKKGEAVASRYQDAGIWEGSNHDLGLFRASSDWTQKIISTETTLKLPDRAAALTAPKLDRVTREGLDAGRSGKNVTPAEFKEAFGFADVGFGNWVGAKNDQDHLNYSYDAFMDLAKHFGTSPKNIGFGGSVHFTIGALGHGKFSAHYHPAHPGPNGKVQVINVTNTRGDGTVYHEWSHALDHNLGGEWDRVRSAVLAVLQHKTYGAKDWERVARRFLVGGSYFKGNKRSDKLEAAIRGIKYYTPASRRDQTAYKQNADKLGKNYWGNDFELFARAIEAWSTDTLGGTNTYLVNPEWSGDGKVTPAKGYRGTPYPTGEERALFNKVMGALAKSVKWEGGKPTVSYADFVANLPEDVMAGEARRKELMTEEGMKAYQAQLEEEALVSQTEKDREAAEKAQAEREKAQQDQEEMDRIAAEKLAELEPATVDAPPPDQSMGPLSDDDLSDIFDQAAAELREESQEKPDVPPPGAQLQEEASAPAPIPAALDDQAAGQDENPIAREKRLMRDTKAEIIRLQNNLADSALSPIVRTRIATLRAKVEAHEKKIRSLRQNAFADEDQAHAAPATADPTAVKLIAEAAKLGVKGADEALKGLSALFGKPGRLNSFPGGFDEETYAAAKPHFKAALTAFQEAGKTLKDLFKMLIGQFGDGIKAYAIQFAKDEGLTNQLGSKPSASMEVAAKVEQRLKMGHSFDWRVLFGWADEAFGGTQGEGKYTPKDAYDAMEAGVNRYLMADQGRSFNPNASPEAAMLTIAALERVTALLPTQSKRTAEQDAFQQYSTVPALAYAANWVANITSADTMMEPSAGIGGLALFAKNAGAKLILNELSSRRAAVLRDVFPGASVYSENAEQINNILPRHEVPTVVVMNPPFSATAGRMQNNNNTKVGALHVEQALKRTAPGGRLVAIVGDGMSMDKPTFKDWWKKIQSEYDVRAVIPMDGSGYAKYGTTFDNVVLVIDKVKPSGRKVVTKAATNYSELIGLLSEIRNDRPESTIPADDRTGIERDAAESALGEPAAPGEGNNPSGQPDVVQPDGLGGQESLPQPDAGGSGSGRGGNGRGGRSGSGTKQPVGRPDAAGGNAEGSGGTAGGPAADDSGVTVESTAAHTGELTESVFESYSPQRLQVAGAKPHPGPLVQSAAMASVLPPAPTYTPNLPKNTVEKGLLSIAQIEAIVYAGQAHSEFLEPRSAFVAVGKQNEGKTVSPRRGFFIGDGTGVGKGREIGGIILDNMRQGRKKHVWISEKQGLMNDAARDYLGIGAEESPIFNQNKTKAEDAIPPGDGVLFTTYSTLRSGAQSQATGTGAPATKAQYAKAFPAGSEVRVRGRDGIYTLDRTIDPARAVYLNRDGNYVGSLRLSDIESIAGYTDFADGDAVRAVASGKHAKQGHKDKKAAQSRLDQLVAWLGEDFDGVIAFDEAHNAGNAVAMKGERGSSQPSAQALAVVELQERLPNARVVYVSATGATQVSNLSYATRLGLWGPGTPFASVMNFIAEMTAGGLAAMELVARDMKQMGAYIARSLSFEGVTYSRVEHELTPMQHDIYNRMADAWQVTLQNMEEALKVTGAVDEHGKGSSKAKMAAKSAYWGAQQRFFNQIITSMQMPSVLEQIEKDIASGDAVILQLVNTNEAQQNRAIAKRKDEEAGESTDLEDLDLTPRDQLIQMVQKSFPVVQYEQYMDEDGKVQRRPVVDSQGNPVVNVEAERMRDKLVKDLEQIKVPDGPLEIIMNHFGADKVAEVTGRTQRVVRKEDKDGNVKAQLETRGSASARADADAFMADKKQILVFSDAGGTGFSFHADLTKKNQRKRKHYLLQPGWRADKAVQGFGRSHRTNQKSAPHYYLASTNIPAQKRFLSAIARRLDQLGALTKGQRDTANQGLFSEKDNLESKYATQAVRQLIEDMKVGRAPGLEFKEFLRQTGLEDIVDDQGQIAEAKIPTTRLFLNRMLSLTLDMQDLVFDAFIERMEEKIEVAAQRGELDTGMQTIKALESRVVSDDVVYTDEKTGAETRFVELELTHPTIIYNFPEQEKNVEWLVNVRSGKVWGKVKAGMATLKTGAVVDRFRMRGTGGIQLKDATEFAGGQYNTITEAEARMLWQQEIDKKPKTWKEQTYMVVGAMLPIWDRLRADGLIKVARTQTVDGQRLLGMVIDKKNVADLRKRLDITSAASKLDPAQVMARILKGDVGELANGWKLERARVSDDLRIELKPGYLNIAGAREIKSYGVIEERINWKERYFVPTGKDGVPVLAALFKNKPLVDLIGKDAGDMPAASRSQWTFSPAARAQASESVERLATGIAARWERAPKIVVVFDMSDPRIPERVRAEDQRQRSGGATGTPAGFYYQGTVYLMASMLTTPQDTARVLFHEALGHFGLRNAFGKELKPILQQIVTMRRAQVDAKVKEYGLRGVSNLDRLAAAEEVLAEMAQNTPEIGFVKRAIAAIRTWLRNNVPGFKNLALSDAEIIRNYILPARGWVENGTDPGGPGSRRPAMSRTDQLGGFSPEPFYSALAREVAGINAKAMAGPGWQMAIQGLVKNGKVKADELEWSGLTEWLQLQDGKVTKEQVHTYLDANGVQVEEVILGQPDEADIEALLNDEAGEGMTREEAIEYLGNDEGGTPTKYVKYQLPGGTNYREVLLTLPSAKDELAVVGHPDGEGYALQRPDGTYVVSGPGSVVPGTVKRWDSKHFAQEYGKDTHDKVRATQFKSGHWDQPNVLAHIRVNDRVDADGKRVLFVEEIQSDWGQAGKKQGFADRVEKSYTATRKGSWYPGDDSMGKWEVFINGRSAGYFQANSSEYAIAEAKGNVRDMSSLVPSAPFVTTTDKWLTLALKRIVKMAVDGGYDKVAFVNGEQSAERYDLSKYISRVEWNKGTHEGSRGLLVAFDAVGNKVSSDVASESELEGYIGKEVAQRLLASKPKKAGGVSIYKLSGLDLKVGGEGMKAFYDQIVPNATKALLKKLGGGQMEAVAIEGKESGMWGVYDATDEDNQGLIQSFSAKWQAEKFAEDQDGGVDVRRIPEFGAQTGFTITDAMREKASGGLPMFAKNTTKFSPSAQAQSVQAVEKLVGGIVASWENGPRVVVAFDMQDARIPERIRQEDLKQRSGGARGTPEGFYYDGTAYLMASQLKTPNDTARVLFHEARGHFGRRRAFGGTLKPILQQIVTMRRAEVDAKIKEYGLRGVSNLDRLTAAEEVLAEMAQTTPTIGFVTRAIAAIRTWLRTNVPGFKDLALTDAEIIRSYILPARGWVEWGPDGGDPKGGPKGAAPAFSRTTDAKAAVVTNVKDYAHKAGNRLADFRGLALGSMGRRQLVDVYGDILPLDRYNTLVQQMDADKNEAGAEADMLADTWGKLNATTKRPEEDRHVAEMMHDATLARIDPDKALQPGDDPDVHQELARRFNSLSAEGKAIYRQARTMYAEHFDKVKTAIRERIQRSEMTDGKKAALMEKMDAQFFGAVKGVYFPLQRFGQYTVLVRNAEGDIQSVNRAETLNEAEETRRILLRTFPAAGGFVVGKVLKAKEFNSTNESAGRGFMKELFDVLDRQGVSEDVQDSINQLYLASLPDLSWAKHGIHRKGTPGFSQDARRAFAQNMFHGARYLAKIRYSDQLQTELEGMQEHVDSWTAVEDVDSVKAQQVVDEMAKRHELLMNPDSSPISTALTSLGFVFHLGLSPASALVNLSQTALVAYPIMGAKWGFDKASSALLRASKEAAGNRNDISKILSGDEKRAYDQAVRSGVIDVTQAHDLAGISQGEDAKVTWKLRPVMKAASFLFHHAEKFNRQVTFVASFRLAKAAGAGHEVAYEQAVNATYGGHFDYSASNRPRYMQGNVARVVLLFKQYAQNMIFTLGREAQLSITGTAAEKKEARRALAGLLTTHALAAGAFGLPLVGTLLSVASMLGGDDDEPWDAKTALQNMLADSLGQKPAEVIAHGLSRLTPWDISGRVGLDKLLLPDIQEGLQGSSAVEAWMTSALGAVAGIAVNAGRGMAEISEGRWALGLESMMPTALRGPLKAYRFATEGNIDKTGIAINEEVSAAGAAGQALGFSPSETRNAQEGRSAIYQADKAIMARRSHLLHQYGTATMAADEEGRADAREAIQRFNEKNPKVRINPMQMMQSVRNRQKRVREADDGVYLPKNRRGAVEAGAFSREE